ncbi:MAG: hypothetical protein EXR72_23100 [Myxococcales bacterium]|nr:hypothetical protein [Myxococcales bacterium]
MSDELHTLGKTGLTSPARATEVAAVLAPLVLPFAIELPTRYYGRLALGETAKAFAGVATVDWRVGDGAIHLTFTRVEADGSDGATVVAEFLNHALYASAIAGPEYTR